MTPRGTPYAVHVAAAMALLAVLFYGYLGWLGIGAVVDWALRHPPAVLLLDR